MVAERIPCAVPFCRRTASREKHPHATEIICWKHYRLSRKRLRRLYRLAQRRLERDRSEKGWRRCWRLWEAIKAECIAAAGATP
jgi:hypothetical protein